MDILSAKCLKTAVVFISVLTLILHLSAMIIIFNHFFQLICVFLYKFLLLGANAESGFGPVKIALFSIKTISATVQSFRTQQHSISLTPKLLEFRFRSEIL